MKRLCPQTLRKMAERNYSEMWEVYEPLEYFFLIYNLPITASISVEFFRLLVLPIWLGHRRGWCEVRTKNVAKMRDDMQIEKNSHHRNRICVNCIAWCTMFITVCFFQSLEEYAPCRMGIHKASSNELSTFFSQMVIQSTTWQAVKLRPPENMATFVISCDFES